MQQVLANCSASISELKKNPTALIRKALGAVIAILNHNRTEAYLVPADTFELIMEQLDDQALAELVREREHEEDKAVEVSLDDL